MKEIGKVVSIKWDLRMGVSFLEETTKEFESKEEEE